jgi:hypothetical protein
MTKKAQEATSRRDFLKMASVTAPAAVAATVMGSQTAEAAEPDLSDNRMQDTAHTRAYLESARF